MQGRIRSLSSIVWVLAVIGAIVPSPCDAQGYTISTAAGGGPCGTTGDGGPASKACVQNPWDVTMDAAGNLYIADNSGIRKVTPSGIITKVAGGGQGPGIGDGGPATAASLSPTALVSDSAGNLYIADSGNRRIRKLDTHGTITTVAGNGIEGNTGDGGAATSAAVGQVLGIALDSSGNLYFVGIEKLLRKIDTNGIITTLAGRGSSSADGGPATGAVFGYPTGVAVDTAGNIYVADGRIRKIDTHGTITTVAGNGMGTSSGDGGKATQAGIDSPWHVAVDASLRLYITQRRDPFGTNTGSFVREVAPDGTISTIAGTLTGSALGDGGPATSGSLSLPEGIAVTPNGAVYVADTGNDRIRLLTPTAPPAGGAPAIKSGGVVSAGAFGAFSSVAPGSWIEIYGSNLAAGSRGWAGTDFNGVNAPTSLDGTKVTIGGQSAFIDYISPAQVNAQVPSNVATGQQSLVISTASGASNAYMITVNAEQPGLLAPSSFSIGGKQYVTALFSDGATYVLPPAAIAGLASRRAQPGDNITFYGVGFGPVTPNISAGQIVQQTNSLAPSFHLFFGGTEASVSYAGLAPNAVGLYQFNVVVPNVPGSDAVLVTFTLAGVAGTQTLYIAVQ